MSIIPVPSTAAGKSSSKSPNGSKSPKSRPPSDEALVIAPRDQLRPAQTVAESNVEHEAQQLGEEHVAKPVEKPHRLAFHRIDEPRAVDEVCRALAVRVVKPRQPLRRHREVGIENRQHVARRFRETEPYGIGLAFADLLKRADTQPVPPIPRRRHALDFLPRAIARVSLDEDHFGGGAEIRHASQRILDVSTLVAGGNHDAERRAVALGRDDRAQYGNGDERQPAESGNCRHHDIQQRPEPEKMPRQIRDRPQSDELESREPRKLLQIGLRDERDDRRSLPQADTIGKPEQPREVPVVERDDDASAPAEARAHGLEQTLEYRSSG